MNPNDPTTNQPFTSQDNATPQPPEGQPPFTPDGGAYSSGSTPIASSQNNTAMPGQPFPQAPNPVQPIPGQAQPNNPFASSAIPSPSSGQANGQPLSGMPPLPDNKKPKVVLWIAAAFVVVLIVGAIAYGLWSANQSNPDKVFRSAINNAFSTKRVTQSSSDGSTSQASMQLDATNVADPKVSVDASINIFGTDIKLKGYGGLKNSYIYYSSFGSATADKEFGPIIGKWIQLRKNGALPAGVDQSVTILSDPRYIAFGDFMFGNFSNQDRQQLTDFVVNNKIYKYDSKSVTSDKVNGKKVLVYPITENTAKLKELNVLVAKKMGLKESDIKSSLSELSSRHVSNIKLYIDVSSKRLVKVTLADSGQKETNEYSDYNSSKFPGEPQADLTWADFERIETDLLSVTGGSSSFGGGGVSTSPLLTQ